MGLLDDGGSGFDPGVGVLAALEVGGGIALRDNWEEELPLGELWGLPRRVRLGREL